MRDWEREWESERERVNIHFNGNRRCMRRFFSCGYSAFEKHNFHIPNQLHQSWKCKRSIIHSDVQSKALLWASKTGLVPLRLRSKVLILPRSMQSSHEVRPKESMIELHRQRNDIFTRRSSEKWYKWFLKLPSINFLVPLVSHSSSFAWWILRCGINFCCPIDRFEWMLDFELD